MLAPIPRRLPLSDVIALTARMIAPVSSPSTICCVVRRSAQISSLLPASP